MTHSPRLIPGRLTPGQCRAARGFLDWTQEDLAERSGLSRSTVRDFEKNRHELHSVSEAQIVQAFEQAGIRLIGTAEGGPGVCLVLS